MYVNNVSLENFRNYKNQKINFCNNINIIYGDNAQGKTNIIEAIYLCCMGKSFRAKKDMDLIKFNEKNAIVNVEFVKADREGEITFKIENQKTFFINGVKQSKVSDIIGKINCVIFTPDDIEIVKGGPDKRRKFIDMMISSLRPKYIYLLNDYKKIIEQRNNYLKQIVNCGKPQEMLDIWDEQLAEISSKIYDYRNNYVEKIKEKLYSIHKMITDCGNQYEDIKIKYISSGSSKEIFLENIRKSRNIDIQRGYTGVGVHRDDIIIYINHKPVASFGSQGQQRTVVLSLKLSELKIVTDEIGDSPILLLDDFMSELDEKRRTILLEKIKENQVIITCTDKIDIESKNKKIYFVENGICSQLENV
ncbi:MAG: DNA replication/repair protein RecF [Clostridia bacterium]|nr:DNA replication/repair protein RecF [Clostridia bacterium]